MDWIDGLNKLSPYGISNILNMKASVYVKLKEAVLDPQGLAIQKSLKSLGYDGMISVRQGKVFDIEIDATDKSKAKEMLESAANKLLANTVIEDFEVKLL